MLRTYKSTKTASPVIIITMVVSSILIGVVSRKLNDYIPKRNILSGYYGVSDSRDYYFNLHRIAPLDPNWEPDINLSNTMENMIAGESGIIVDMNKDTVLYSKEPFKKMKIASLTKVMTAIVALEHADPEDILTISSSAASIGENSMGISAGEAYTLHELLYGLILPSGNDAAYAIAEGIAGTPENFVSWMNIKAQELGMRDTVFYDPSGLDDRTTSTASDLVKLTKYALKSSVIRDVSRTTEIELVSGNHKYLYLENQTNLLRSYPGVDGLKTGYTEEAGLCLITHSEYAEKEYIGVVLNSIDRKGDMVIMLDYAHSTYGIVIDHGLLD